MSKITTTHALAAAVAGAVALTSIGFSSASYGADGGKEKCFGVSKAGENGCASANGTHSCAGQSKIDFNGLDWKLVDVGTCVKMDGSLKAFNGDGASPSKEKKS